MAPTKKDTDASGGEAIRALCLMVASSAEFNPDYNVLAPQLGIAAAKNVARKLDGYIKPYGFQVKNKKIIIIDDADCTTPTTPRAPKSKTPVTPGTSDAEVDSDKSPFKGKTSPKKKTPIAKKEKTPKKAATPKGKKRKIEEVKNESDSEDDEATKMIKEKMGGDTDEELDEKNGDSENEADD